MRTRASIVAGLALVLVSSAAASGSDWRASEVVTSYVSGTSPTLILGFDNNLEICLALRDSKTVEELASIGVRATRSQMVLLRLWNLLESDGEGGWRCTLPVIESPRSEEMQTLGISIAARIATSVRGQIDAYLETIAATGWSEHRYALLGSFVLDGLVWEALEQLQAIPSADASTIPSGSEHWSGVSWITLPPRLVTLGTDSYASGRGALYSAWTPASLDAQDVLRREGLREDLIEVALGRDPVGLAYAATLRGLGLLLDGEARIPAIETASPLCGEGGRLAISIAEVMLRAPALQEMLEKTGARDNVRAMIMAYHWIYPALLEQLGSAEIEPPPLLAGEPNGQLAPTLFVVGIDTRCVRPEDR